MSGKWKACSHPVFVIILVLWEFSECIQTGRQKSGRRPNVGQTNRNRMGRMQNVPRVPVPSRMGAYTNEQW